MRLLFARVGIPYSPATGLPIESQTVSQMVDRIMAMEEGARLYLLAPVVRGRKGEYRKEFATLQKRGFQRVKVDGELYEIGDVPQLDKKRKHDIEVVVDRVIVRPDLESRLADSLETALELADGLAIAEDASSGERVIFSARFACPVSGFTIDEIEPRLFSFNNPYGACPACDGLGTTMHFDEGLAIPDTTKSLTDGVIRPWANSSSPYYRQTLDSLAQHFGVSMSTPFRDLPDEVRDAILNGTGKTPVTMHYDDGLRSYETSKPFEGVMPNMERRWRETDSSWVREELERYQSVNPCPACEGFRLKPEALAVKISGHHAGQVSRMSIAHARQWFLRLDADLTDKQRKIAETILKEINERLGFLINVGLEYLTLDRGSATLSGGEGQRIRLASQIGSGLMGVLYVLDEPSIGLHPRDNGRLLGLPGRSWSGRRHPWWPSRGAWRARTGNALQREPDRPVPHRIPADSGAGDPPLRPSGPADRSRRRHGQQPAIRRRRHSARDIHLRHRRLGQRQVHLRGRNALPRAGPPAAQQPGESRRARHDQGPRIPR
jgi:excinuclease ABC subunit A